MVILKKNHPFKIGLQELIVCIHPYNFKGDGKNLDIKVKLKGLDIAENIFMLL
jgi:hypothetical protein